MKIKTAFSQHHIYGIQQDKSLNVYRLNSPLIVNSAELSIRKLMKIFKNFRMYLTLWHHTDAHAHSSKEPGPSIVRLFKALQNGDKVDGVELKQPLIYLIMSSPGFYLRKIQTFFKDFEFELTPQYRLLVPKLDFNLNKRDELIFHSCNPDCYVWIPPNPPNPKQMLIVFLTKNNTLNMPRPFAHFILARLGIAIMYVGSRTSMTTDEFIAGHNLEDSANIILDIAREHGCETLFGIGTSYGGFKACRLAELLGLKRVLNFSGAQKENPSPEVSNFSTMSSNYPKEKILSVLSKNDDVDKAILASYDNEGFVTPRDWVESSTHGSFTAAFIEDKLDGYLHWLFEGD